MIPAAPGKCMLLLLATAHADDTALQEWAKAVQPVALLQLWGTAYDQDVDVQADATGYATPRTTPGSR